MIAKAEASSTDVARFRAKLLVAMMLVISTITALALYLGQRRAARAVEQELHRDFEGDLAALQNVQQLRHAALVERCRALLRRPRIHAALEDGALDLLYPSAEDELRDIMANPVGSTKEDAAYALHAEFYRFLDRSGAVIPPVNAHEVGALDPGEEKQLALPSVPDRLQLGYVTSRTGSGATGLHEVFAMPIVSSETGEIIAALVLGFQPASYAIGRGGAAIRRGVWVHGRLHMDEIAGPEAAALEQAVGRAIAASRSPESSFARDLGGTPQLLFYKRVNPGSLFPPAYEVCVYPLAELRTRQRELRWQVAGVALLLLLGGFGASHVLAARLARPVEKLAVDSAENRAQRERAEAALELTSEELQRAARFSADASHQLKTPVTVLRAGLEELLARENLTPDEYHEISALIHQTYRLSGVIEDLLLLSRMDAGRLKIEFQPVDLTFLIEAALDDLGAESDGLDLTIETDVPAGLQIEGEKRYLSIILQNLLENARKYNRPGGRIRIAARDQDGLIRFSVGNTGRPIPAAAQAHIFERFHRGLIGENVPGYGLGLNLARELVRLHRGELRLVGSDKEWTEFEVVFPPVRSAPGPEPPS